MLDGKREGTLYLVADLQAMTSQLLKLYGGIFALVLAASLLLAFLLSSQFLRFVTNPILSLAGTARTIADHHDYSVRADEGVRRRGRGVDRRVQPDADANPVSG